MEPTVYTPQLGDLYLAIGICGFLFVTFTFLAFRLNKVKTKDPRRRVLLPMLSYFVALLALMGLLGSFFSSTKFPVVEVHAKHLVIDGERVPKPRRGDVRMESNTGGGLGQTVRVLLLQTRDHRTLAFPSDRYDVNGMMRQLMPPK